MNQGFIITAIGWEILAKAVAGECKLNIAGVAFGSGRIEEGENPATFTGLKKPIADGAISHITITTQKDETGVVKQSTVSFIAEYRSDYEGPISPEYCSFTGKMPVDIDYDFNLNEFGVYAENPDVAGDFVLIYYATLGDNPHPVTSYAKGAIDIRRYPVSIALSSEIEVALIYPPLAFVTSEEMQNYAQNTCKPQFLELSQKQIDSHNVDPKSHPDLRNLIASNIDRLAAIEDLLGGSDSKSFRYDFNTLDGIDLQLGVYNAEKSRIEF